MKKENSTSFFGMLWYFTRGLKVHISIVALLAVLADLVETFNLALLYPMLSTGFGISTDSLLLRESEKKKEWLCTREMSQIEEKVSSW
ncbi:MAG: hypothetical protein FWF19_00345 [Euryarchaeota archaeon]|nr:hypothetical protein [Euryarchaeota archaeon]